MLRMEYKVADYEPFSQLKKSNALVQTQIRMLRMEPVLRTT